MSSLPQPPPVSLGSVGVRRRRGDTPRLCSQGLGGSPLPRLLTAQRLQQELAQCSGSLRTGLRGNRNEIILSKGRQRNVKFSPRASLLSIGIMLMTTKNRAGGRQGPSMLQLLSLHLAGGQQSRPQPLLPTAVQLCTRARRVLPCAHAAVRRATSHAACANACVVRQLAAEKLMHPETSAHSVC